MSFNDFMVEKEYYRYRSVWYFNKKIVSGKELSDLLEEYKTTIA